MKKWLIFIVSLLPINLAFSQVDPETIERLKKGLEDNLVVSSGSLSPSGEARIAALKKLPAQINSLNLAHEEKEIMLLWADEARSIIDEGNAEFENRYSIFCEQLDENTLPIEQQISGYVGAIEDMNQQLVDSFDLALSEVDNVSRLIVESHLQDTILPTTVVTNMDIRGLVDSVGEESTIATFRGGCMARDPEKLREIQQRIEEQKTQQNSSSGYLQGN